MSDINREAYGRCPICQKFMWGYEDENGFHTFEHECNPPIHGGYEPGIEEPIKDKQKIDRIKKHN